MHSLIGEWSGGPHGGLVRIRIKNDGTALAEYKTSSGKKGGMSGMMMEGGKRFKGSWWDEEKGHPAGASSMDRTFDMRLDPGGKSWTASWQDDGRGDSGTWNGKPKQWRKGKKVKAGWYKNKESWDRLTAVKKKEQWAEAARVDMLADTKKLNRTGLFGYMSESLPLAVGATYNDRPERSGRAGGLNFLSGGPKKGHNGAGCYFSTPTPLAVGDKYIDPVERAKQRRLAARKKMQEKFGDRPAFKPQRKKANQDHLKVGFLGELDKEASKEEIKARIDQKRAAAVKPKARDVELGPRNIITRNPPKGGFGFTGNLLGHRTEEGKKLFEYQMEGDAEDPASTGPNKKVKKTDDEERPAFFTRVHSRETFTEAKEVYEGGGLGPGGGAEFSFRQTSKRRRPASAPVRRRNSGRENTAPAKAQSVVSVDSERKWIPPRAPRRGPFGTFSEYPEHVPDPVPEAVYHVHDSDEVAWKPNRSGMPPRPMSSVLFSKRNIASGTRMLTAGGSAADAARTLLRAGGGARGGAR